MKKEIDHIIKQINSGIVPAGYKRTKAGIIPADWEIHPLSQHLSESRIPGSNGSIAKKLSVKLWNKGVCEKREVHSGSESTKYYKRKKGQFIYSKLDFLNCAFGIIPEELDGYESTIDLPCFDFSDVNDYYFLSYITQPKFYSHYGMLADGGRKARRVDPEEMLSFPLVFPPLPEQQKIAEILSTQDKVIELKEKLLEQKQLRKKYLMMQLLSGAKIISGGSDCWKTIYLKSISTKIYERNDDFKYTLVLSNSAQHGIIPQNDQFDKDIANDENIDGYYVVHKGDFVYNPRISVTAPCGPINVNDYGSVGVVSPLYTVFSVKSPEVDNIYLKHYFKSSLWHKYMKSVANYGARHDRMAISNEDFFMMPIFLPPLPEQQAIAEVLSTADKEIDLLKSEIEQEKLKKKSLMQLLLTGIVRVKV